MYINNSISLEKQRDVQPSIHEVYKITPNLGEKEQKFKKLDKKQAIFCCYPCVMGVEHNTFQLYMIYACLINLIGLKYLKKGNMIRIKLHEWEENLH